MKKTILLAATALFLFSCQENKKVESTPTESVASEQVDTNAEDHEHSVSAVDGLYLNNGEAWEINEEMKPFVINAKDILNVYNQGGNTNYVEVAVALKEQNQLLINSCTMQGESHDVLHEWLVPHLELTKELENAADENAAKAIVSKLNESFTNFGVYFK